MRQFIFSDQSCIRESVQNKGAELCFGGKRGISCLICDVVCVSWVSAMAKTLRIPFAILSAISLSAIVLLDSLELLASHLASADGTEQIDGIISRIPGVLPLGPFDIPEIARSIISADNTLEKRANSKKKLGKAVCRLANSFQELEQDAFQALAGPNTLPIGPLLPMAVLGGDPAADLNLNASNLKEDLSCLEWLQKQAPSSVIYVSFGSVSTMSALQVEELTQGLQASNQPFLWVFRPDFVTDDPDFCLEDLKHRLKGQGLMVSWAPQMQVQEAIGGFLTHGGWNSVIESICMGKPMLGWPLGGEQHLNCKYIVDGWKIGVRTSQNGLILKEEICKLINILMKQEEGNEMRRRAMELANMAKRSWMDDGSSFKNLVAFKEAIQHCH